VGVRVGVAVAVGVGVAVAVGVGVAVAVGVGVAVAVGVGDGVIVDSVYADAKVAMSAEPQPDVRSYPGTAVKPVTLL
jgi:hypothetical protein